MTVVSAPPVGTSAEGEFSYAGDNVTDLRSGRCPAREKHETCLESSESVREGLLAAPERPAREGVVVSCQDFPRSWY